MDQNKPCSSKAYDDDVIELGSSDDEEILQEKPNLQLVENELYLGNHFAISVLTPPSSSKPRKPADDKCGVHSKTSTDFNLVDEKYELLDPNPNIHELFVTFDQQFFWGTLTSRACIVEWSKTMTSCAGICRFNIGIQLCCIRLSEPLLKLRPRRDLVETLLHEMIHAYLFVTGGNQDRDGHGMDFQLHMHRINRAAGTSITIYHSFHVEVAHYKQHWWRCTGPCRDRAPFYGWVKRAMNRAPSPNDLWWNEHRANCSGEFVKVKEPEKKETKSDKRSQKRKSSSENLDPSQQKIDTYFPGKGYVLGTAKSSSPLKPIEMEENRQKSAEPIDASQAISSSNAAVGNEKTAKRRKRTKEEIEEEKLEKEVNKVRRQIQSAKNTKCEQYLYCHFSSKILDLDDELREELRKRFEERGLLDQIVYEPTRNLMQVLWRKKRLDAYLENGKLHKNEKMELQTVFCCVLSGETFSALAKTKGNSLMEYLREQMGAIRREMANPKLTVIVLGKHSVRDSNVYSIVFEAYEKHRVQFRFTSNAKDFSYLIVQYHRSLAKLDKKSEKQTETEESATAHFVAQKGVSDGGKMVTDWWGKMLDHLHGMKEEQKRAIVESHPNPARLMDWLLNPDNLPGPAMYALSEIQMESGRRLGPVLAQKIYRMLTSRDGTESMD